MHAGNILGTRAPDSISWHDLSFVLPLLRFDNNRSIFRIADQIIGTRQKFLTRSRKSIHERLLPVEDTFVIQFREKGTPYLLDHTRVVPSLKASVPGRVVGILCREILSSGASLENPENPLQTITIVRRGSPLLGLGDRGGINGLIFSDCSSVSIGFRTLIGSPPMSLLREITGKCRGIFTSRLHVAKPNIGFADTFRP